MTAIPTVLPRYRVPARMQSPFRRMLGNLGKYLPTITSQRKGYQFQAQIMERMGDAQSDLVMAKAYYDGARALRRLARG